ncbi:hypothetical protein L7F22_015821 [Adiantum nelumboides]|nr:hypothetical protein [Adiantum nelumboides]
MNKQCQPDHMGCFSDDGNAQWHHTEEKAEQLKERLSVALLDALAKDVLVKQHAKVVEEAVSGWEKADKEALNLKQDLDSVMQQKLATEDRVAHLDSALKECMQQLRHVREEQEAKIHDATLKNLRDWERMRAQLEEKLVDMEKKYLDTDAENKVVCKLLQEQALMISELNEARSCAESNVNALQGRLQAMERDHNAINLDCSNLKHELETRNEEKVSSRKSTVAASKQHLEDARKIAKLEGECQRLRSLVRNKLPGCGALMQTKPEVDSLRSKTDSNKKKVCKGATSLSESGDNIKLQKLQQESPNGGKNVEALSNRLCAMEDETRRLKELLVRRDNELQHSRLMCARTASKLSSVEEQLECLLHDKGSEKYAGISALDKHIEAARSFTISCEPSLASVSEDGNDDCSDAWASALISELAHIKTEKGSYFQETRLDMPNILPENANFATDDLKCPDQKLAQKDVESNHLYEQDDVKPRATQQGLTTLQFQNAAPDLSLQAVQCQVDIFHQDSGNEVDAFLGKVTEAISIPSHSKGETKKILVGFKQWAVEPRLTSALGMLAGVVENLAVMVRAPDLFCKSDEIKAKIRRCSAEGQLFYQGGADIIQILEELASIFGGFVKTKVLERETPPHAANKAIFIDGVPFRICGSELVSSISDTIEPFGVEEQANKVMHMDMSRVSTDLLELEVRRLEGELMKVQGEKVAMETHMRMEFQRFEKSHDQFDRAEQAEASFKKKLSSAELSRHLMEEQLQTLISAKTEAESQLEMTRAEYIWLQDRKGILERECAEKIDKITGLELKCQELAKQLSESGAFVCSQCSSANGGEMAHKEIALKLAECQQTVSMLGKQLKTHTSSTEQINGYRDPSITTLEAYQFSTEYNSPHNASELHSEIRGLPEVCTGVSSYNQRRVRAHTRREMDWERPRDSNASNMLDWELMSLSNSGRPLLELFGDKTPAHEHYIKAVEQLTSSSDDEFSRPKRAEPLVALKGTTKPPLHRKKKSQRSYTGVDLSKSMDETGTEKVNTFTRFFSRVKNS